LEENIHFMWLSGGNRPDHRTINRFRSDKLKGLIQDVFTEVLILLAELGHVKLEGGWMRHGCVWRRCVSGRAGKPCVATVEHEKCHGWYDLAGCVGGKGFLSVFGAKSLLKAYSPHRWYPSLRQCYRTVFVDDTARCLDPYCLVTCCTARSRRSTPGCLCYSLLT